MANVNDPYDRKHPPEGEPVRMTADEARQGGRGRPVLLVLAGSLLLAMVAWAAAEFWGLSIDNQTSESTTTADMPSAAEPANENEGLVDDNPPAGVDKQPEPTVINPDNN